MRTVIQIPELVQPYTFHMFLIGSVISKITNALAALLIRNSQIFSCHNEFQLLKDLLLFINDSEHMSVF